MIHRYSKFKKKVLKIWNFCYQAVAKYIRDDLNVKAGGLAFYQLLTIIPILMLLFYFLGRVLDNSKVFYKVLKSLTVFNPDIRTIVVKNIDRIKNTGVLTVIFGFFLFLFLTRKYLRELHFAVRKIIGETPHHPTTIKAGASRFIKNYLKHLSYIFLYIFMIATSATLSSVALNYFGVLEKLVATDLRKGFLFIVQFLIILIPIMFYVGFYYIVYRYAPDFKPKKRYALAGAIFTSLSTQILNYFYKLYVEKYLISSVIYGPLSAVAALVMWYYFSSIVVLFGAVIVFQLNRGRNIDYHI